MTISLIRRLILRVSKCHSPFPDENTYFESMTGSQCVSVAAGVSGEAAESFWVLSSRCLSGVWLTDASVIP